LSAGSGVVTGTRNNTFGYLAGQNLTSGTNNVFMGSYSGKAFTTGVSNTICGEAALITEDAGDKNTAIGAEALKVQTGGIDGNVAVGYYAGFALTSGSYNTIIGTEAMSLNAITGEQNVAVGYRAGKNITTGAGNVLIGKYAGADTTLLTTGNQNIVIGPFARTSSASVSNEIVIGYNVPGSGEGYAVIGNGNGKISVDFEANATWSYSSDERLKKDIVADDLGLSFINRLETVKYKWKPSNEIDESLPQYAEENTRKTNVVMHGMVAQTVKAALDAENVDTFAGWSTDLDGTQMVSREMFVTPLIKAVQELSAKNDALEARLAVLEG
jgi:trimeric autotransporter adhesin